MIRYGIPIYSQVKHAQDAIAALLNGTVIPDEIVIIDNSEKDLVDQALFLPFEFYKRTHITTLVRDKNILSGAWNDFMRLANNDDYMIVANDDVAVHKNTIEELIRAADNNPKVAMFSGNIHDGNSYSFFLLRKWAYDIVGPFDERFTPAYYEDNDYDYRLQKIHRLQRIHVENVNYDHIVSATVKAMNHAQQMEHNRNFIKNGRYYEGKWGGMPGKEKYMAPFAGIDFSDL